MIVKLSMKIINRCFELEQYFVWEYKVILKFVNVIEMYSIV